MLTQQLRELEEDNIIERKVYNQVPPKVEYYLSDYGQSLSAVLDNLCNWGRIPRGSFARTRPRNLFKM